MALKDVRARATVDKGKDQGRTVVSYVDARGRTRNAHVLGAGTSSGLKLQLMAGTRVILDDVPKATTMKTTLAYRQR